MSDVINNQDEIDLFEIFNVLAKHIKMILALTVSLSCVFYAIGIIFVPEKSFETTLSYASEELVNILANSDDLFSSKKQLEYYLAKPSVRATVFPSRWNDKKQEWVKKENDLNHPEGIPTIVDLKKFVSAHLSLNLNNSTLLIKWQKQEEYEFLKAYFDDVLNIKLLDKKRILSGVKNLDAGNQIILARLKTFANDPVIDTQVIEYSKGQLYLLSIMIALILSLGYIIGCEILNQVRSKHD
ncbi:MAG: hypothetical protein VX835_03650 [Pseudomonadota bacterium]|nr:hypothetical protein [Pseudomonadota bacterium]